MGRGTLLLSIFGPFNLEGKIGASDIVIITNELQAINATHFTARFFLTYS